MGIMGNFLLSNFSLDVVTQSPWVDPEFVRSMLAAFALDGSPGATYSTTT
jgi:hypothetical protein